MKYYILKCNIESKEFNEESYGIMLLLEDGSREYWCNISDCVEDVEFLVDKMNNYHIEQCQAKEIIEDFKFNNK